MYVLGLTGPIASGKSYVEDLFFKLGASVIDTDKVVHKMYESNTALAQKLSQITGKNLLNESNTIDRDLLRQHIQKNPTDLPKIEGILYPILRAEVSERLHSIKKQGVMVCVLSVPMMFEGSMSDKCNSIACCSCPDTTRKQRAKMRKTMTEDIVSIIMSKQKTTEEYCALSDHIIPTGGSKKATQEAVKKLHISILKSTDSENRKLLNA